MPQPLHYREGNFFPVVYIYVQKIIPAKKKRAIHVTGRGGLKGCEMLRIPHCTDNRLIDGSETVRITHRPRSTPQEHSWY
jgi:hypothetical protein